MNVPDSKWKKTQAGSILNVFSGLMTTTFRDKPQKDLLRAQYHIPLIFWRWMYLEYSQGRSPYIFFHQKKISENWPKNGQFMAVPDLQLHMKDQKPHITVNVTLDYVSFFELPLFVDLQRYARNEKQQYTFDAKYMRDIKDLQAICTDADISVENLQKSWKAVVSNYFDMTLLAWRLEREEIGASFTVDEWLDLWRGIFRELSESGNYWGYGTDMILDPVVTTIRSRLDDPDYAYITQELSERLDPRSERVAQWVDFWVDFAYFFLVPFSLYLPVIAPYFGDEETFNNEVREVTQGYYEDVCPLHSPPSYVCLQDFGKKFLTAL